LAFLLGFLREVKVLNPDKFTDVRNQIRVRRDEGTAGCLGKVGVPVQLEMEKAFSR